jgi:hypothetical protein
MWLFTPFWLKHSDNVEENKNYIKKALKKISTICDDKLLVRIVSEAPLLEVKYLALGYIKDKKLLAEIVSETPLLGVKQVAIVHIKDDKLLAQIAEKTDETDIKIAALDKIKDKDLCRDIICKIADESLLNEIFMKAYGYVAEIAFAKIPHTEDTLAKAVYANDTSVRMKAVSQIRDKATLSRIAQKTYPGSKKFTFDAQEAKNRVFALEKEYKNSPEGILDIAKNSSSPWERFEAAKKLTDMNLQQEIFYEIAAGEYPSCGINIEATDLIADKEIRQEVYLSIACRFKGFTTEVKKKIAEQLTDRELLKAAMQNKNLDSDLRVTLVEANGFTICEKCGATKELIEHSCACPNCGEVCHLFSHRVIEKPNGDSIAFNECVICGKIDKVMFYHKNLRNAKELQPEKCPKCGEFSAFKNCRCENCGVEGHMLISRSSEEKGGGVVAHWDEWDQCVNCSFETEKVDNWRYADGY